MCIGSGSSSSVVTVIAAEDPNGSYTRRRYHKPPPLEGDIGGSLRHEVARRSGAGRGMGPT